MTYLVTFEHKGATAKVTVWDEHTATLNSVYAKFRRRGAASEVIYRAIEYTDYLHLDLFLEVEPFGKEPLMSETDLKAFYMSFGFYPQGNNIMMRSRNYTQEQATRERAE